uniref:Putative secreted protein n=1 Tax=Anopheles triannulatus TaxID=58253 RepID=A0A2M4B7I5_9DIPT
MMAALVTTCLVIADSHTPNDGTPTTVWGRTVLGMTKSQSHIESTLQLQNQNRYTIRPTTISIQHSNGSLAIVHCLSYRGTEKADKRF